jgi:hypothetical protein
MRSRLLRPEGISKWRKNNDLVEPAEVRGDLVEPAEVRGDLVELFPLVRRLAVIYNTIVA